MSDRTLHGIWALASACLMSFAAGHAHAVEGFHFKCQIEDMKRGSWPSDKLPPMDFDINEDKMSFDKGFNKIYNEATQRVTINRDSFYIQLKGNELRNSIVTYRIARPSGQLLVTIAMKSIIPSLIGTCAIRQSKG